MRGIGGLQGGGGGFGGFVSVHDDGFDGYATAQQSTSLYCFSLTYPRDLTKKNAYYLSVRKI